MDVFRLSPMALRRGRTVGLNGAELGRRRELRWKSTQANPPFLIPSDFEELICGVARTDGSHGVASVHTN